MCCTRWLLHIKSKFDFRGENDPENYKNDSRFVFQHEAYRKSSAAGMQGIVTTANQDRVARTDVIRVHRRRKKIKKEVTKVFQYISCGSPSMLDLFIDLVFPCPQRWSRCTTATIPSEDGYFAWSRCPGKPPPNRSWRRRFAHFTSREILVRAIVFNFRSRNAAVNIRFSNTCLNKDLDIVNLDLNIYVMCVG